MKTRTKSKKVNKAWLHDHINDPYVKLAQREGYRAASVLGSSVHARWASNPLVAEGFVARCAAARGGT